MLTRMTEKGNEMHINSNKSFDSIGTLKQKTVSSVLDFAYDMTFGKSGEHRNHRSGGTHTRKKGEIFANTFQGKLCEFAIYNSLFKDFERLPVPDTNTYGLGEWDDSDFILDEKHLSVKSTKSFGNLLLLETKDWNNNAEYIPNIGIATSSYDFFILVRLSPSCEDLMKKFRFLYSNNVEKSELENIILNENWKYDIPGFITNDDLKFAINNNYIINRGELLNGKTKMDATNYYVQTGDMKDISTLKNFI